MKKLLLATFLFTSACAALPPIVVTTPPCVCPTVPATEPIPANPPATPTVPDPPQTDPVPLPPITTPTPTVPPVVLPEPPPVPPVDGFDLSGASVCTSYPQDVAIWPVTTKITALDFTAQGVRVEFDKKDGPNRWPDVRPCCKEDGSAWDGDIQYTLWIAMQIGGRWYTNGPIEYWHGLDRSGGNILAGGEQIAINWTYDCGVMKRQPAPGELVGFFVTAGDQRKKDYFKVHERSNVIVVPFPATLPITFRP
jgi:hypothetical protein